MTKSAIYARSALYARVSTEEQARGLSIETQLEAGRKYAAERGWVVAGEYIDPGLSGTTDARPAFQQMIRDGLNGKFDALILNSFDRFARNMEHSVIYKNMLRQEGVQIVSLLEPIDPESPVGFVQEGMIDLFAAYYSINLSVKIKNGLSKAVQTGKWPFHVPVGYQKNDEGFAVPTDQAPFIAKAFQEFASGQYTLEEWAHTAHDMGFTKPGGQRLYIGDWSRMFHNPFYKGLLAWSGLECVGGHQPLIDELTWQAVQDALLNNNNKPPKRQRYYLLKSLVWSLDANGLMNGAVGKGYRYYRSRKSIPGGTRHHVLADVLEAKVGSALKRVTVEIDQLPDNLNESLVMGLRCAPNVGVVYNQLTTNEQRRALLIMVVTRYGLKISGNKIVEVETNLPFFQFDQKLVEMAGVEPASKKAGCKRLRA